MHRQCLNFFACCALFAALALQSGMASGAVVVRPQPLKPDVQKYQAWRTAAAKTLGRRANSPALATAAALSYLGGGKTPAAVEWAARASELAPNDAAIAWLRLQICANTAGCDIRDAATNLRWVDADNGAAWLPTLTVALREKDSVEVDRILDDMAQGVRFDLYWSRLVVLFFDVLKSVRSELPKHYITSDVARLSEALGVAGAVVMPTFNPLIGACRDAAAGERREACAKLARTMQRADTVVAQMAGFSMERRLATPDSREARANSDRRRAVEWRCATANRLEASPLPWLENSHARARVAQMRRTPREEDVCIAVLRAHRLAADPPEDRR